MTGAVSRQGREFSIASRLDIPPADAWEHAISPAGVNREFHPLLRMTFPLDTTDLTTSWRPGERLFRSWLLLGGILPLEYDDVTLVEVEPGHRFLERSPLLSQRVWEHERVIEAAPGGCRLTDRLRFVPRLTQLTSVYATIFATVFRFRHRNLRRIFGGTAG
jgi:hypothetical protein